MIRIGDKLFFVARLEPPDIPRDAPKPKPAEQKQEAKAAKSTEVKLEARPLQPRRKPPPGRRPRYSFRPRSSAT